MSIRKLHAPEDSAKIEAIAESMRRNGWVGYPVLVCDEDSNEPQAFNGSHRLAAAEIADIEPEVYSLEEGSVDVGALYFDCKDDEDRMEVIKASDDEYAIEVMQAEIKQNANQ